MKQRWNRSLWAGFGLVLAGFLTYIPVFAQFPITRDFPWVNLLLFAAGLWQLGVGLLRAYGRREQYRGRVFGPVLAVLSVATVGLFVWGVFIAARDLPVSAAAPRVGQKAPDFTLPDQDDRLVALADLISGSATTQGTTQVTSAAGANGALLIFYRGHW